MRLFSLFLLLICAGCYSDKEQKNLDNLEAVKNDFISTVLTESVLDEGPFHMNFQFRAIIFSDAVVSLMGDLFVRTHLPHGWTRYEGKTYVKRDGFFKEITLKDLFHSDEQKEFLRCHCENFLKTNGEYLLNRLELESLKTFVVDHESLIVILQPYEVNGFTDAPVTVKISFVELIGKWQTGNPLEKQLPIKNYLSTWDNQNWISDIPNTFQH